MNQYHLLPDEDSDEDHTTDRCQCGPLVVTPTTDQGWKEQVVFHYTDADYDYLGVYEDEGEADEY